MADVNIATEEAPILSRLNRLDNILKQLEMMRGTYNYNNRSSPGRSSYTSSGTLTTTDNGSDFSPNSAEKHCRPIDDVVVETEVKGTLIERLVLVEDRVVKLEEGLEVDEKGRMLEKAPREEKAQRNKKRKGGLKELVKSCVKGFKGSERGA